jgi:hypothetical protein
MLRQAILDSKNEVSFVRRASGLPEANEEFYQSMTSLKDHHFYSAVIGDNILILTRGLTPLIAIFSR